MIETPPPPPPPPVDVVPPCRDGAEPLPRVPDRIPPSRRAILGDSGSADIARDLGAYVVHEPRHPFGTARHPGLSPTTAADVHCCDEDGHDAWLGPTADGGFWALDLADPSRAGSPVWGVPLSTDRTGAVQRRRLVEAGLSVRDLPFLRDVDTAADAASVVGLCPPGSRFAAVPASFPEGVR